MKNKLKMNDEQRVFNANMCFICHLTLRDVELKQCSSCKLVSYCSKSHQRKHWRAHKEFCRVTQYAEKNLPETNVDNDLSWYKYRINLMILCEVILGRKLMHHEMNMILFPNNCYVCHKRTNLEPCWSCLSVSYCSNDHKDEDSSNHTTICELFSLCCKTDLYQEKTALYPVYDLRQDLILTDDIKKFIATNLILERNVMSKEIEEALLSEVITCPLTLLYALTKLNHSMPEHSVIHLVGSSMLETSALYSWDLILDLKKHIKEMVIHFIGPDANTLVDLNVVGRDKLTFKFTDQFYHDFVKSEEYEKPDVICAFNCGFHEFEGTQTDTWKKTLPFLIENEELPFIFTSFTKDEAERDVGQLLMVKPNLNAETELNPFSSLRPYRDPENSGVYFNNRYLTTVKHTT